MALVAASVLTIGVSACGSDKDEDGPGATLPTTPVADTGSGSTPDTQDQIDDQSPGEGGDGMGENGLPTPGS